MARQISDEQWTTLTQARETRPAQASRTRGCLLTVSVLAMAISAALLSVLEAAAFVMLAFGIVTVIQIARSRGRSRPWRRRFKPTRALKGRRLVYFDGGPAAPRLGYQVIRDKPDWEWLTVELEDRLDVEVQPKARPIGDPNFDRVLGLNGTEHERALLGPTLRINAPHWHAGAGFILADGQAKVKLGVDGYDDRDALENISTAYCEYADRLCAPPMAGLSGLARDLAHPFDAARALAALYADWPDDAEAIRAAITNEPIGPALARVAQSGQGLIEPTLDWPTRSAIGRGVLGVTGTASEALAGWLEMQVPTDDPSAMALVDLGEAGAALLNRTALQAQAAVALAYVIDKGGPECLAWMQARARHDKPSRLGLKTLSARLEGQHRGFLSLEDDSHAGALSEARAGELSITGDPRPA